MSDLNKDALGSIRAKVIKVRENQAKSSPGKSTKANDDPLYTLGEKGRIIEAPFDPLNLTLLLEQNTELGQCVETMEVNIDSFGHRFVPINKEEPGVKTNAKTKRNVQIEKTRLKNFFETCTSKISFTNFRRRLRKDLETTGNYYFEVIRNEMGDIQQFVHIPSYQVRLGKQDENHVKTTRKVYENQPDGSLKIVELEEWVRFRTYVQSRLARRQNLDVVPSDRLRWFKEFGDKRVYNYETGDIDPKTPLDKRANELIHVDLYSARSPYGLPRYIGNLLSIFGDRASEEINYVTFRNNNIPSMVVLCSNGQLTQGTIERIESFVESQVQGSDNYSQFLIIEAEGEEDGEDGSQVKVDIKPLVSEQHKDALFQNYSKNNKDNVRRSWRIPPIFLGQSGEYNKDTAGTSRRLADEQIFAPERNEFDSLFNRRIFPELGVLHHKFRSNSPNTTDNSQLVTMLATAEKTGGMTPFIARFMLEDILGRDLPEFTSDFDEHVPFSLLMAEAVKNKADPTEPGQQVTAIKSEPESEDFAVKEDGTIDEGVLIKKLLGALEGQSGELVNALTAIQSSND